MWRLTRAAVVASGLIAASAASGEQPREAVAVADELAELGALLFSDPDLSRNRTQSCASCHDPAHAFSDPRRGDFAGAVSLGDDGVSYGVRNAPTLTYVSGTPARGRDVEGHPVGGLFHDGRAATLEAQAGEPILSPAEMAMPDRQSVAARLREKPVYVDGFEALFGPGVLDDADRAFAAATQAIAAFERRPEMSTFDSRYDRALRGEASLTEEEELGRVLFFSRQFTNCQLCHKLSQAGGAREPFTNYRFHNIGVPPNPALAAPVDHGLMARPDASAPEHDGRFKVPTLRNVAVTPPYMHNGVFQDLRTVILFYNQYNSRSPRRQINPETGERFAAPEVSGTLSTEELQTGPALDDRRIDALVAFLKTLTDQRYEPLLAAP